MKLGCRIAATFRQGDGEGRQRRLEPMCQIGDVSPRPFKVGGVLFE